MTEKIKKGALTSWVRESFPEIVKSKLEFKFINRIS